MQYIYVWIVHFSEQEINVFIIEKSIECIIKKNTSLVLMLSDLNTEQMSLCYYY